MDLCILIPVLVGLISALLGYLLGRLFGKGNDHSVEIDALHRKNAKLEADLATCHGELTSQKATNNLAASAAAVSSMAPIAFDGDAAKAVFGKRVKQDDLTFVEGIGPKIQELFHNHQINTWKSLSETSVERCKEILSTGGERFSIHDPGTWPRQAKMAYEGKWQDLLDWQDILDGGKE